MKSGHHDSIPDVDWPAGTCPGCEPEDVGGPQDRLSICGDDDPLGAALEPNARSEPGASDVRYGSRIASSIDRPSVRTGMVSAHLTEDRPQTGGLVRSGTPDPAGGYRKPPPDQPVRFESWPEGEPGRKTRLVCVPGTDDAVTAIGNLLTARRGG